MIVVTTLDSILHELVSEMAPHTMVPAPCLRFTWTTALRLIREDLPGVLVECGTWLGGCAFGMALVQKRVLGHVARPVYLMDSFEGLPPATDRDGPAARQYQSMTDHPGYLDNCRAPLERVLQTRASLGLTEADCPIVPGWFQDTVPSTAPALQRQGGIALLRVDCDWYHPVRLVLDHLMPLVPETGVAIIDDYYAWDGAARAVHDWLSANDLPYRIRQGPEEPTWAWLEKRAAREFGGPL